jgi:hypothetical protein
MSDSLGFALAILFAEIVPAAIGIYAAYWAFAIRRALAGRIYRNHALWLGVVCILGALSDFLTYSNNAIILVIITVFYIVFFAVIFAFVDSTVRVARRSDPLLRSILHWETLRIVVWCVIGVFAVVSVYSIVNPSFVVVASFLISIPFIAGAPALLIGARRSRDPVLRESLKWLGVTVLFGIGLSVVSVIEGGVLGISTFDAAYSYPALPGGAFLIMIGYSLYRCARSLAPTNRLPRVESETTPAKVETTN